MVFLLLTVDILNIVLYTTTNLEEERMNEYPLNGKRGGIVNDNR